MPLSPFPVRDAVVTPKAWTLTQRWREWFLDLWTQVNRLMAGQFAGGIFVHGQTVAMGARQTVPFDTDHFGATGVGTGWDVLEANQRDYAWAIVDETLVLWFDLVNTNVVGAPANLTIALPAGYVATGRAWGAVRVQNAGAPSAWGLAVVMGTNDTSVALYSTPGGTGWAATANGDTGVQGYLVMPVGAA